MRPQVQRNSNLAALVALGAVAVAVWIDFLIDRASGGRFPFVALSPTVAMIAWYGGLAPAIVAILVGALATDYYVIVPGSILRFESAAQGLALLTFVAGWVCVTALASQVYRRMRHEVHRRNGAERAAAQAHRLAQLTAALSQARNPTSAVESALQEPLHALKADAGMLLVVSGDGESAEIARSIGYPNEPEEGWPKVSLQTKSPVSDAVRRRAPVILDTDDARLAEYAGTSEAAAGPATGDFQATLAIPLVARGRAIAVVRLDFRSPRAFTSDDRELLFALGPRAALALDRTWRYEAAQRARIEAESLRTRADQELNERQKIEQALRASESRYRGLAARTSRLHGLTAALSEAVTLDAVARAVVHQGRIVVGATTGDVTLLVENGTQFETLYAEEYPPRAPDARRFPVEAGHCSTEAVATKRSVYVGSFAELQERYWRSASLAADGGYDSSASLPLMSEGNVIGVLAFHFTVPVNFDDEYRQLLESVAQHCAQALDRARLYEAAQKARAEAEAANRLKDDFLSIVSHELRTPLNAMLGWAWMLRKGSLEPAVAERAVQSIHDNATRQARLIDELLDFSRIVAGRATLDLDNVDLSEVIRGVVESVLPVATANGLEIRVAALPAAVVVGDIRRLEQVFFNLIGNALKFTPAGGRVTIEATPTDGAVEIRVIDNGIGIERDFLPHVFDRFRQADTTTTRQHGGLGLGLSIARQLVEAHKGTVAVQSDGAGQGSTFVVRLPLAPQQPLVDIDRSRRVAAAAPRLDGIRVLVVDDEADARDVMAHALEACGARVTLAATAADALDILVRNEIDVLLADIAMPEEDGYSLIRKIRAFDAGRIASIPAAAVTAHARDEERQQALEAGFHVHVAKPVEPAQLAKTVETLVRGNSVVH
jgi:K+-sensing histidine kinase KdpD/ActR/RegA family two-component response regulator